MVRKARKRCVKCGQASLATPRQRHCYRRKFGRGSYACWGDLVAVVPAKAKKEAAMATPGDTYRAEAGRKLAYARRQVSIVTQRLARATTSLRLWERRAAYYAKRAAVTDAELAAERATRQRQDAERAARRVRRGIKVGT